MTLKIVVVPLAALFFKVNRGQLLPGIHELGSENTQRRFSLAFPAPFFVKYFEGIAFLDILFDIDVPGKNVSQLRNQRSLQSDPVTVLEERCLDGAAGGL